MAFDADSIKDLRLFLGLTMTEFAGKVGVSYQCIQQWEAGKNLPRPRHQLVLERIRTQAYEDAKGGVQPPRDAIALRSTIRAIISAEDMTDGEKVAAIRKQVE